jgi:ribosomal protein L37E
VCPGCLQLRPHECGASDDAPELCDYCWNRDMHTTCPRCRQHTFHLQDDAGKPHCAQCAERLWRESFTRTST